MNKLQRELQLIRSGYQFKSAHLVKAHALYVAERLKVPAVIKKGPDGYEVWVKEASK